MKLIYIIILWVWSIQISNALQNPFESRNRNRNVIPIRIQKLVPSRKPNLKSVIHTTNPITEYRTKNPTKTNPTTTNPTTTNPTTTNPTTTNPTTTNPTTTNPTTTIPTKTNPTTTNPTNNPPTKNPTTTHKATAPHTNVAVVMAGMAHSLSETQESILQNVIQIYKADIFYSGPHNEQNEIMKVFNESLKYIVLQDQILTNEFVSLFLSFPDAKYFELWGENATALGPVSPHHGTNLLFLFWQNIAYDLLSTYEHIHKFEYEWVIHVRPDMEFAVPLPPLNILNSAKKKYHKDNYVLLPQSSQSTGVTDRFAILTRAAASVYFGQWKAMIKGTYADSVHSKICVGCNAEMMMKFWLRENSINIYYMPQVGATVCDLNKECIHKPCVSTCREGQRYQYDDGLPGNEKEMMERFRERYHEWRPEMLNLKPKIRQKNLSQHKNPLQQINPLQLSESSFSV
jgi:hypothetical protein